MTLERRNTNLDRSRLEARAKGNSKDTVIEGYAAVFDQPTVIWDFEEVVARGAFKRALSEKQDIRTLFNHDPNYVLGRTKNSTLILREDEHGLWTETDPPKTPIADSIVENIRRKDVDGMSFAFTVRKQEWIFQEDGNGEMDRRVITEIGQMYDVGPVTFPAYQQTSVKIREEAKRMHGEARSRWLERRGAMIQVPQEYELVLKECRSDDSLDEWTIEEAKNEETEQPKVEEKAGETSGEKTTEGGETVSNAEERTSSEAATDSKELVEASAEAIYRSIELKRKIGSVSKETRKARAIS